MTHGMKLARTSERTKEGGELVGIPATPNFWGSAPDPGV
jgi:hypothetical protein